MIEQPSAIHDATFMQAFLDLIIPPSEDGRMPGAGSLALADEVAAGLQADAMLGPMVRAGVDAVRDAALALEPAGLAALPAAKRLQVVEHQLAANPLLMFGLGRYLYPAYYGHPRVLEGLGEPVRPPFPEGYEVEETDPDLLEILRSRPVIAPQAD